MAGCRLPPMLALLAMCGCAALRKETVDQHVIRSRQLTQQAQIAIHQQKWDDAEDDLVRAIESCPEDGSARRCLSDVLWNRGAAEAAIEQMTKAIELAGKSDPEPVVRLGRMQLARGRLDQALQLADEAIRIDRGNSAAWELRANILRRQGQLDQALAGYFRALDQYGDDPRVRLEIAEIYYQQGRHRRALATLQAVSDDLTENDYPQRHFVLKGLALRSLGRPEDAVRAFLAAREIGPPTPDLLYQLATAQLSAGQLADARWSASAALEAVEQDQQPAIQDLLARIESTRRQVEQSWR